MASDSDSEIKLTYKSQTTSDVAECEFVLKLIALYRDNPILWNTNNEHYTNKYRRIVTLQKICETLKQYKPHYSVEDLKRKLNILRTNFNKENNKMDKRKSMFPDKEPESTLWYFNEMLFLIGQEMPVKRASVGKPVNQPVHKLKNNLKRKKISIITESSSTSEKRGSEEEILAKYWANKLRKLTPEQRLYAEKIINDTLFEAELGTLTRHGASFNGAPVVWTEYNTESHSPVCKSPSSG